MSDFIIIDNTNNYVSDGKIHILNKKEIKKIECSQCDITNEWKIVFYLKGENNPCCSININNYDEVKEFIKKHLAS